MKFPIGEDRIPKSWLPKGKAMDIHDFADIVYAGQPGNLEGPVNVVPLFSAARQSALDDPSDLQLARERYARHAPIPLSAAHEVALQKILHHEQQIAAHADQIRYLRMELQSD